jgi:hypothetical protein
MRIDGALNTTGPFECQFFLPSDLNKTEKNHSLVTQRERARNVFSGTSVILAKRTSKKQFPTDRLVDIQRHFSL